jgi:hypothetical protein
MIVGRPIHEITLLAMSTGSAKACACTTIAVIAATWCMSRGGGRLTWIPTDTEVDTGAGAGALSTIAAVLEDMEEEAALLTTPVRLAWLEEKVMLGINSELVVCLIRSVHVTGAAELSAKWVTGASAVLLVGDNPTHACSGMRKPGRGGVATL